VLGGLPVRAAMSDLEPAETGRVAFERGLEAVREAMDSASWDRAESRLSSLLEVHGEADYVRDSIPRLELDVARIHFFREHPAVEPRELIDGELLQWNRTNNRIKVRYEGGLGRDGIRASSITRHPLDFSGPYKVTAEGAGTPPPLVVGWKLDGFYIVQVKRSVTHVGDWKNKGRVRERDVRYGSKARIQHIVDGKVVDSVEKESKRDLKDEYTLSVSVSSTSVSVKCNGSQLARLARRGEHYGAVALVGQFNPGLDSIVLEGEGGDGWLLPLVDDRTTSQWIAFRSRFDAFEHLPAWMRADPLLELARWDGGERGPGSTLPAASLTLRSKYFDPSSMRHAENVGAALQLWADGHDLDGLEAVERAELGDMPLGWARLMGARFATRLGRIDEAEAFLDEAQALGALPFEVEPVRARILMASGAVDEAMATLEQAEAVPAWVHEAQVALLISVGRSAQAREVLRTAADLGSRSPGLMRLARRQAALVRGPDFARVHVVRSRHFEVRSGLGVRVGEDSADILEHALKRFEKDLGDVPEADQRFAVELFPGESSYRAYLAEALGADAHSTAGLYSAVSRTLYIWNLPNRDEMLATVRHEGLHQYLHRLAPETPRWLNEGLAEFYEHAVDTSGRWKPDRLPRIHGLTLGSQELVPLERFVRQSPAEFMGSAQLHYAQAWALVSFLWTDHKTLLLGLLDRLRAGAPVHAALDAVFDDVDMRALHDEFDDRVDAQLRQSR
jgi:tetratricopeptide (TPR) repeat protein